MSRSTYRWRRSTTSATPERYQCRCGTLRAVTRASDASLAPAPTVSIVIPTHDRRPMLEEAVASALAQREVDVEVIVVDDDSSDDTEAWLESRARPAAEPPPPAPRSRWAPAPGTWGWRPAGATSCCSSTMTTSSAPGPSRTSCAALDRHPASARSVGAHQIFGEGMTPSPRPPSRGCRSRRARGMRSSSAGTCRRGRCSGARTSSARSAVGPRACDGPRTPSCCLRAWRWPTTVVPTTVLDYRCHPTQAPDRHHVAARLGGPAPLRGPARPAACATRPRPSSTAGSGRRSRSRTTWRTATGAAACGFAAVVRRTPRVALSPLIRSVGLAFLAKSVARRGPARRRRGAVCRSAAGDRRGRSPDMRRSADIRPSCTPP